MTCLPVVKIRASRESSTAPPAAHRNALRASVLSLQAQWVPPQTFMDKFMDTCALWGKGTNNFIYMHPQQEADRTGIGGFTHTHIPVLHPSELWIGWDVSGRHLLSFKSNGSNRHTSLQGHCKSSCVSVFAPSWASQIADHVESAQRSGSTSCGSASGSSGGSSPCQRSSYRTLRPLPA